MKKLLLIDTFNFLHRAYHALPKTFKDPEGNPTNAVYGVTAMLINVFELIKPDYVVAALDDIEPTFRVADFTGYKAHRSPMEEDLSSQIPKVFEIIDAFGIQKILLSGYEADDVIGTLVQKFASVDIQVIIVSNDRDMWQLIDENVLVMTPTSTGSSEWIGAKEVFSRFGFNPIQMIDYKGLRGDPSDNIPGVPGVGEKTAKTLIEKFGTIDNLYNRLGEVTPDSLRKKLTDNYEQAIMSRQLATIIKDAPLTIEIDECKYRDFNRLNVRTVLEKYNFKSLIRRLGFEVSEKKERTSKSSEVSENQLGLL